MFNWFKSNDRGKGKDSDSGTQTAEKGLFSALKKSGDAISGSISNLFDGSQLDDDVFDEIEEILIKADVSLDTAVNMTDNLRKNKARLKTKDDVLNELKAEFTRILTPDALNQTLSYQDNTLNIYLVVGVNGAGKTTFIGKLAHQFKQAGKTVVVGAGDTFRAAAVEQLQVWAERSGATFIGPKKEGADPSGVLFDAIETANKNNANVVLLDTAGRLQNKFNLMEELEKVKRTIDKARPESANLECLLVLDATTGQNALSQAEIFNQAVNLDGVILTKLDGSAKGGVILTIAEKFNLPVKMVGVGEGIDDLKDFDTQDYLDALFQG